MIHIPRLPWNSFFMLQAHLTATRSTCDRGPELLFDPGRHGVGCVLERDHRVIAGGYNGSPPGHVHCDEIRCVSRRDGFEAATGYGCPDDRAGCGWKKDGPVLIDGVLPTMRCPQCSGEVEGGHLMVEGHCRRTIHSEANALLQCALDGTSPEGATLYTTASPCHDCAKLIIRAKISQVIWGSAYQSRYGLSDDVQKMLTRAGVKSGCLCLRREELEQ